MKKNRKKIESVMFDEADTIVSKLDEKGGTVEVPIFYDEKSENGIVVLCYHFPIWERLRLLFGGDLYIVESTYHKPIAEKGLYTRSKDVFEK